MILYKNLIIYNIYFYITTIDINKDLLIKFWRDSVDFSNNFVLRLIN